MTTYDIVLFLMLLLFPMPITTQKKRDFIWIIWKDWTYFFKTGCSIIGFHSTTCTKDFVHSPALVCTRGVFGYGWWPVGGMLTLLTSTEVFQDLILLHRCLATAAVGSNIQRQRILFHSSRRIQPNDTRFYATAAVRSNIRQTNDSMPQQPRDQH